MTDLLTNALPPVTLAEQITAVEREIALRRRVYPRWVSYGRMRQAVADEEIRRMEAVAETLKQLQESNDGR